MNSNFDRDYYELMLTEKFPCEDMDDAVYFSTINEAIEKTLDEYTENGKLLVEDWDMFEQELYGNAYDALSAYYD
jgi:hypothetical protein